MEEVIVWPEHCDDCPYKGITENIESCDYCYITGKMRKSNMDDCQHYLDKNIVIDESIAIGRVPSLTAVITNDKKKKRKKKKTRSISDAAKKVTDKRIDKYTQERNERFKALYDQGKYDNEIAKECKVSEYCVFKWRKDNGLPAWKLIKVKAFHDEIDKLYAQGLNGMQISRVMNVSKNTIYAYLDKRGINAKDSFDCDCDL